MGFMRKQMLLQQRASIELTLQERLAVLSKRGLESPRVEKDTIVRKLKADIRAVNKRLQAVAAYDRKAEETPGAKAGKAAPVKKGAGPAKGEKPKKAAAEGKAPKAKPEGGKPPKAPEAPAEAK